MAGVGGSDGGKMETNVLEQQLKKKKEKESITIQFFPSFENQCNFVHKMGLTPT